MRVCFFELLACSRLPEVTVVYGFKPKFPKVELEGIPPLDPALPEDYLIYSFKLFELSTKLLAYGI